MKINDQWQFDQDKRWMAFDWEVIEPIYRYCLHNYQDNIVFHLERLVDNKDQTSLEMGKAYEYHEEEIHLSNQLNICQIPEQTTELLDLNYILSLSSELCKSFPILNNQSITSTNQNLSRPFRQPTRDSHASPTSSSPLTMVVKSNYHHSCYHVLLYLMTENSHFINSCIIGSIF